MAGTVEIKPWERDRVEGEIRYQVRAFHDLNASRPRELHAALVRRGRTLHSVAFCLVQIPAGDPDLGMRPGPWIAYESWDRFLLPGEHEPRPWRIYL